MNTDRAISVHSAITLEQAESRIRKSVYEATRIIEDLEHIGRVSGNGHHARQQIAEAAVEELRKRWKN